MDLIYQHRQEKKDRKSDSKSICDMSFYSGFTELIIKGQFEFDYHRYGKKKHITFEHGFSLNLKSGDVNVSYRIINDGLTDDSMFRNTYVCKQNDFKLFYDFTENCFTKGEKRLGYWGVKFQRGTDYILENIHQILKSNFKEKFFIQKNYKEKYTMYPLFDMIVDYHLDTKNIKSHDGVYYDIRYDYPKKKWLLKNDNKFLPAVLDNYGIKSKYLISELSNNTSRSIQLSTLNYLCKLFGANYLDYIKKISWDQHCYESPPNKKIHELKNESEKNCMVSVINKWEKDTMKNDSLIYNINKLLSIRLLIEERGLELKFKAKNDFEFENTMEIWSGIKLHFARGFKVKYDLPKDFIDFIEEDIVCENQVFKPKLLVTEEDFRIEGFIMKNCMAKQFPHGALYLYCALSQGKKRINLQFRKGILVQSFGKANTQVNDSFEKPIQILSKRFNNNPNIEWKKEKYDFLMN